MVQNKVLINGIDTLHSIYRICRAFEAGSKRTMNTLESGRWERSYQLLEERFIIQSYKTKENLTGFYQVLNVTQLFVGSIIIKCKFVGQL